MALARLMTTAECDLCGRIVRACTLRRHKGTHDPVARFWSYVDKVSSDTGCWLWTSTVVDSGYGRFHLPAGDRQKTIAAHRYAYEQLVGPIPSSLQLDHLCCNRICVNPAHLEPVTGFVNVHRSAKTQASINARKTHCPSGHPYDALNTRVYRGERECLICRRRTWRECAARRYARKRAVA